MLYEVITEFEDKSGEFLKKELDEKVYHMIPENKFMLKGVITSYSIHYTKLYEYRLSAFQCALSLLMLAKGISESRTSLALTLSV